MALATAGKSIVPTIAGKTTAASPSSSVFDMGSYTPHPTMLKASGESPPLDTTVMSPLESGTYPVLLFLHGYLLSKDYYTQIYLHIASHGYIVVAPQTNAIWPSSEVDITEAAKTSSWLSVGLNDSLPKGVRADPTYRALSGHSRGGHAAFSLALGYDNPDSLKFSALIGIDPVAGFSQTLQFPPPTILTNQASSFALDIPVLVIGTGLGPDKKVPLPFVPSCAPEGVNHAEFYKECRPPCYHLVVTDYGHLDLLDDDAPKYLKCVCVNGSGCREPMRRSIGGIVVAFLEAKLGEQDPTDLQAILDDPEIAPAKLFPVEYRP
ncbi:chlorophyllase-2, chloroplastic [Iris pallida]|uniref:Chlorophyllase-2, chloroplastic n=1 Tax=Iris pallida TaxID=29817 RepID=A0AAX6HRY4_IRIPA|nr:chlorophyllase-2, chloroplastic [Iris pallida]